MFKRVRMSFFALNCVVSFTRSNTKQT